MPGNGTIDADERTGLLASGGGGVGGEADESQSNHVGRTPYHKDSRIWVRWPMNTLHISYHTLMSNYVNVLLVFVPLGIVSGAVGWDPTTTFVLNFLAIIPLASLLSFATEELAAKLGQTLGGLLNATFGNAVELIVSIYSPRFFDDLIILFLIRYSRLVKSFMWLMCRKLGQHRGAQGRGDSHRSGEYARKYLVKYPPGLGMLLPRRWVVPP
jgi:hypothetical protein